MSVEGRGDYFSPFTYLMLDEISMLNGLGQRILNTSFMLCWQVVDGGLSIRCGLQV